MRVFHIIDHKNGDLSVRFSPDDRTPIIPKTIPSVLAQLFEALPGDAQIALTLGLYSFEDATADGIVAHLRNSIRKHARPAAPEHYHVDDEDRATSPAVRSEPRK